MGLADPLDSASANGFIVTVDLADFGAQLGCHHFATIDAGNEATQPQLAIFHNRVTAQWHLATTAQGARESAFGLNAMGRFRIIKRRDNRQHIGCTIEQFNAQRALPRCGQ